MKTKPLSIAVAVALTAAAAAWSLSADPAAQPSASSPPAGAVAAALGRVEPASRVRKVAPPDFLSNPRVEQLLVREGSVVKEGELLGWFAGRARAVAALRSAEATIARATAELGKVQAGAKSGDLRAAEARERRAVAQEAQAHREVERSRKLRERKVVATSDAEEKEAAHEVAQAELRAAQQERSALAEVRPVDVAIAEAAVAEAHAGVARAQAEIAIQEIRAPIAGTVLRITVWPGEASDAKGVLELADLSTMQVVAEIYETDAAGLREGQIAEVIVPGRPERLAGTVRQVGWMVKRKEVLGTDPVADIDGRVVEVRVLLDAAGSRLLERMTNQQVQVVIDPRSTRLAAQ